MSIEFIIIPKIISKFKNQFEYSIEINLTKFLKFCCPKCKIEIFDKDKKYDKKKVFIFTGGNTVIKFSKAKENQIRNAMDKKALKIANKMKSKIIGLCHGAQFIALSNNATLEKTEEHKKKHKIKIITKNQKKHTVNSYHNYEITKLPGIFEVLAVSHNNSIEAFKDKKELLLCLMWHPERYKKFKLIDKKIFKKFLCN